jgi:broad specificity phosphatase PhoE
MGYTITLLRAGGTSWDEEDRLIGQTDLPMTEHGSDEVAKAIHEGAFEQPFGAILVSDEEASATAATMLPRGADTKVKTIPELSNIGLGLWEGVLSKDLEERNPSTYAQWRDHPERIAPPEGESLQDAQDRLITAIGKALAKCKGTSPNIAIVLRPLAWATIRCWLTGEKMCSLWDQLETPISVERFDLPKSRLVEHKQSTRASA